MGSKEKKQEVFEGFASEDDQDEFFDSPLNDTLRNINEVEEGIEVSNTAANNRPNADSSVFSFPVYRYEEGDKGPFRVTVAKVTGKINKISLGVELEKCQLIEGLVDIKKISSTKATIYVNSMEAANLILDNEKLKQSYKAYLPAYFISVKGVVVGVPEEVGLAEIKQEVEGQVKILGLYRMNRKLNGRQIPSDRVCITFRESELPESLKFCHIRSRVEVYVSRVVICEKCLRFNHLTKNCKGEKRCSSCSNKSCKEENSCQQLYCWMCKLNHKPIFSQECPAQKKYKQTKKLMSSKALSFQEAQDILVKNRFQILEQESYEENIPVDANLWKSSNQSSMRHQRRVAYNHSKNNRSKEDFYSEREAQPRRWEREPVGVALNNPHKTTEAEKIKKQLEDEIQSIKTIHANYLYSLYIKIRDGIDKEALLTEIEGNVNFELINQGLS